ncbi:MAG: hypothetical protein JJU28_10505 [Cyclobacteriaceae bacterium]|nr:hypothetical protein [Cyclobacteriaceae bacterium]
MNEDLQRIRNLLNENRMALLSLPNVVATGIGYKISEGITTEELSIICSVEVKKPKNRLRDEDLVPSRIQGIPTDVVPTGAISAFQNPRQRLRPAPGGSSLGHFAITAGTLGCLVRRNNQIYILSNNHVIANSNDASVGDAILQPGPADGGRSPADRIASLEDFIPVIFEGSNPGDPGDPGDPNPPGCAVSNLIASILNSAASLSGSGVRLKPFRIQNFENKVDCAIAKPINDADVLPEILQIGNIQGLAEGTLGMAIKKSGRTTGFTTGIIQQIDVSVRVNFGANRIALFTDQLLAGGMSQGGDSGSVVLNDNNQMVGLLFAGSTNTTICNRIQNVFDSLNLELY